MYSYDVSASPGRSATASRSIPGMRPSYDAEHPHSTTPIYDELYSEYRRLFRALPGDRSGEEDLKFTGFAVRDGYPPLGEQRPYPPAQQQAFHTLPGQAPGLPQFVPSHQHHGSGPAGGRQHGHTGAHPTGHTGAHPNPHAGAPTAGLTSAPTGRHTTGHRHRHPTGPPEPIAPAPAPTPVPVPVPIGDGLGLGLGLPATAAAPPDQAANPAAQFTNGQGWVAAGYLGAPPHPMPPHPMPPPPPPAPPAPAPVLGTVTGGLATTPSTRGRHRQMLSLPPGPTGDHH
ncbi:hypothetical protein ACFRAR_35180 [Kitasatospora sp. NPDC056651]|uniref:hypothetical protein n=1 Tax=Kitasatospora sp. NPDC056651 TaxID=3345892 RepID=UPI0036A46498